MISINSSDLSRLQSKLQRLQDNCKAQEGSPVFTAVMKYINDYQTTIVKAMGSVGAEGGSAGLSFAGKSATVQWAGLSTYTQAYKKDHGLSLTIWQATGQTRQAVKVQNVVQGSSAGFFAGIDKATDEDAYWKALQTEYGKIQSPESGRVYSSWNSRPLFTVANQIFKDNTDQIVLAVRDALFSGVNWGA